MSAVAAEPFTLQLDADHDLGGAVVVESFDGRPSLDFQGISFSAYDPAAHCRELGYGRVL